MGHRLLCDAASSAKEGFTPESWRDTQLIVRRIMSRMSAILWELRQEGITILQVVQMDLQMLL
jgi:hypothetical protein